MVKKDAQVKVKGNEVVRKILISHLDSKPEKIEIESINSSIHVPDLITVYQKEILKRSLSTIEISDDSLLREPS